MTEACPKKTEEHKVIWLSPACDPERSWCQDDVYEPCEECGLQPVKYTLALPSEYELHGLEVQRVAAKLLNKSRLAPLTRGTDGLGSTGC